MATPIVHASVGVVLVSLPFLVSKVKYEDFDFGKILILAVFFACLPDIDLLYSYLLTGDITTYHFGVTHTIFFPLLVMSLCLFRFDKVISFWIFLLVLSHVIVDAFTGDAIGMNHAGNIKLFLPFSEVNLSAPITLFQGVNHESWLSQANINNAFLDCMVYLPLAFVFAYFAQLSNEKN